MFSSIAADIEPCTKLGGKIKNTVRLSGEKSGQDEKLCVFGKTAIMNKSVRQEFWKEKTILFDKLKKSEFQKNKAALRKQKFDPLNKETDAVKFCRLQGGTTLTLKDASGEYTICRFNDYSGIEVNAFLRGINDPDNHKAFSSIHKTKRKRN